MDATSTPSVDTPSASAAADVAVTQDTGTVPPVIVTGTETNASGTSGFSWTLVLGFIVLALALVIGAYYLV